VWCDNVVRDIVACACVCVCVCVKELCVCDNVVCVTHLCPTILSV